MGARATRCGGTLIISPEDAERLDLAAHTRATWWRGWSGIWAPGWNGSRIDHHNTDDPHVHLLIRGVRDDGRVLQLDRDYVSRGIRELSQELIERELGPRTEHEVLLARERVIEREQWTEIDRALARRAGLERVVSYRGLRAVHARGRGCGRSRRSRGWRTSRNSGWRGG